MRGDYCSGADRVARNNVAAPGRSAGEPRCVPPGAARNEKPKRGHVDSPARPADGHRTSAPSLIRAMPRSGKGRAAPSGRSQHPIKGGRGRGAIAKASHNSSGSALGAAIAQARTKLQTTSGAAGGNLLLARLSESVHAEEETTVEQILGIVRECFAGVGSLALTELGDKVRMLANRRGLHGLHKQVKDKWGGWEAFVQANAAAHYSILHGVVHARPSPGELEVASLPAEMAVQSRTAEPATSRDVNALSLEGAAL